MAFEIALPYRSDWREMSSVLDYCKGKGADRSSLEARFGGGESLRETLNALEQLGLVERSEGGDARLTDRGEALAYAPDQTSVRDRLVEAMLGYPPYRFPLERALSAGQRVLDGPWVEHIWQVDMRLGQPRNRVEEARTFFYRLADEAGLGTYRRGVRGQTTRLELVPDFEDRLRPALDQLAGGRQSSATGSQGGNSAPAVVDPDASTAAAARLQPADLPMPSAMTQTGAPSAAGRSDLATGVTGAEGMLPGLPQGISIQIDMTDWDLDRIEGFLRLIGYLPGR